MLTPCPQFIIYIFSSYISSIVNIDLLNIEAVYRLNNVTLQITVCVQFWKADLVFGAKISVLIYVRSSGASISLSDDAVTTVWKKSLSFQIKPMNM